MPDTILSSQFDLVVSAAHRMLKPCGYAKSGAQFRRGVEGNSVIIQFQKSAWNSADSLRFTVNFAIMSHRLASVNGRDPAKIFDEGGRADADRKISNDARRLMVDARKSRRREHRDLGVSSPA